MNDKSIESILHEKRIFPPSEKFTAATRLNAAAADALYAEAAADHEARWARLAREAIEWETPFTEVLDAQRSLFALRTQSLEAMASYQLSRAQAEALIGGPISPEKDTEE